MYFDDDLSSELSPAGRRRREQILHIALASARRRRTHRRAIRVALASAAAIAFLTFGFWANRGSDPPQSPRIAGTGATSKSTDSSARPGQSPDLMVRPRSVAIDFVRVANEPGLVDRLRIIAQGDRVERLDDAGLQRELASSGLTGGVIVRDDRAELCVLPVANVPPRR